MEQQLAGARRLALLHPEQQEEAELPRLPHQLTCVYSLLPSHPSLHPAPGDQEPSARSSLQQPGRFLPSSILIRHFSRTRRDERGAGLRCSSSHTSFTQQRGVKGHSGSLWASAGGCEGALVESGLGNYQINTSSRHRRGAAAACLLVKAAAAEEEEATVLNGASDSSTSLRAS